MAGTWTGTTYSGDDTNEAVKGTTANEMISGRGGSDTLKGGGGNDQIYASDFEGGYAAGEVDKLYGEAGNDTLYNNALAPVGAILDGGSGDLDTANLQGAYPFGGTPAEPKTVSFTLTESGSYVLVDGKKGLYVKGAEALNFTNYSDHVTVTGGARSDYIYATGDGSVLKGLGGDDRFSARITAGFQVKIDGGAGTEDTLFLANDGTNFNPLTLTMKGDAEKGATLISNGKVVATIKGIENLSLKGGSGNDTLFGGSGDNSFTTAGGGDKLTTYDGNDSFNLDIASGKDTIKAGGGSDSLTMTALGSTKSIVMSGSLAALTVKTGAATALTASGIETVAISTGSGNDKVFGEKGNDSFSVGLGANSIKGGEGDDSATLNIDQKLDTIDGGDGKNRLTLVGPGGQDAIIMKAVGASGFDMTAGGAKAMHAVNFSQLSLYYASDAADTLIGLAGDDTIEGSYGNDKISGGRGNDQLSGGSDDDTLNGGEGDDNLSGGAGRNTLSGGTGNDTLTSGAGSFDGGEGVDLATLNAGSANDGVTVTLVKGKTVNVTSEGSVIATLKSIENLTGGYYDDHLTGDAGGNVIDGGNGSNELDGGAGIDTVRFASYSNIFGGGLTITLKGSKDSTVTKSGGPFNPSTTDTFRNFENVIGTSSGDTITGDGRGNRIEGGGGKDLLKGGAGNDTLVEGYGFGLGGFDAATLEGGSGSDTYEIRNSGAVIKETKGNGNDTVIASANYTLAKGVAVESLKAGIQAVFAGFNPPLKLGGNELDNTIQGGQGADTLTGGGGHDTFVFALAIGGQNIDTITDFKVDNDEINLDRKIFKALGSKAGDLPDKAFHLGAATSEAQHILYDSKTGAVSYDSDGNKKNGQAAVQFATLDPNLKLGADDFHIV
jgi:Ca2+-binding RTX toxin-like protein